MIDEKTLKKWVVAKTKKNLDDIEVKASTIEEEDIPAIVEIVWDSLLEELVGADNSMAWFRQFLKLKQEQKKLESIEENPRWS